MARTEKYFVGPRLLGDIRDTISRVAGMPVRSSGPQSEVRLQGLNRGGGSSLRFGRVTAAWNKNSLRDVVVYSEGGALAEAVADPAVVLTGVVNRFADVAANKWVMVGRANGRWYLVSAEC